MKDYEIYNRSGIRILDPPKNYRDDRVRRRQVQQKTLAKDQREILPNHRILKFFRKMPPVIVRTGKINTGWISKHPMVPCPYCGLFTIHVSKDHILPRSRGGGNEKNNIVKVCIRCNEKKSNKTLFEFIGV